MVRSALLFFFLFGFLWGCRSQGTGRGSGTRRSSAAEKETGLNSPPPPTTIEPLNRLSARPPHEKGVALGLFSEDSGWSYEPLLEEIKALGASHVSLIAAYYLADIRATSVSVHPRYTAPDRVIRRTIRQARKLGLEVMLFPILRVAYKPTPDDWRGNLAPSDPKALQRSYRALMVRLARLAEEEKVSVFSVGSEMSSLDGLEGGKWFAPVIRAVREVYHGRITYSANWDHFKKTRLWHLVDLPGLCAYFGLADSDRPSLSDMLTGWKRHRAGIVSWSKRVGKTFIFTEVGYPSQLGAAREPWNEGARRKLDLGQQRQAYEAFVRSWNGVSQLEGAYFWNWYGWGGSKDRSYTPRRKPAAQVIAWWYGGHWPVAWWFPR